jgi:indolepyruvate ferredoxin oxidoreductase alpha subunit
MVLDNSITAMTGHQPNPANGKTLKGKETKTLDIEAVCKACGVTNVHTVDPFDLKTVESTLKTALADEEPSVIIARRPCFLLKGYKPEIKLVSINRDKCVKCGICWKLGCPAIEVSEEDGKTIINSTLCVHCGLCAAVCRPGAITQEKGDE